MTLVLEIEHLLGSAFAAVEPDNPRPDWPPQPDRVFSALVAAWGARGERDDERQALEWLEAQACPEIAASGGFARTAPIVFVPPNDAEGGRVGNETVMPVLRRRQARRFPAFRPDDPVVSLVWRAAGPDGGTLAALNALAADTAYIGHSASLTRCRFRDCDAPGAAVAARRRIYDGRLAQLAIAFLARSPRRPRPGDAFHAAAPTAEPGATGVFSDRWLVLEHVEGDMPDIRAAAPLAKELRNVLMSGYRKADLGDRIPAEVSGHTADGSPSRDPHLAIAPLAFLGWPHASGAVLGFALIPPCGVELLDDPLFQQAVRAILRSAEPGEGAERRLRLKLDRLGLAFEVGNRSGRRSLDPVPYLGAARVWASCTPIVLDRHLKARGNRERQQEIEDLIRQACANIGLPEPIAIAAGRHSAVEGAAPAYRSPAEPPWLRWKLPESLANRQLIHAVVEFKKPVRGPVILGAGRFVGLGLCRRLELERRG